jgi:hypothetical protein
MRSVLFGTEDAPRAALIRQAVEDRRMLDGLVPVLVASVVGGPSAECARALHTARALAVRAVVAPLLDAFDGSPASFLDTPDPLSTPPGRPLAVVAYACVRDLHVRGDARAGRFLRAGLAEPVLRVEAFYAMGAEEGAALVPHLAALLTETPALAAPAGTLFALRHRGEALAACQALASAPLAVRRAFGDALDRHLGRVKAVRLAVACRAALSLRGVDRTP